MLGEGAIELASDIEIHAEKIRRERMSKRAKQQQEAEAALTRVDVKDVLQDTPLVGNLIGEGHVNYVLMYNMLTGIRIGVRDFSIYGYLFFLRFLLGVAVSGENQATAFR